jgi:hypothetical protein
MERTDRSLKPSVLLAALALALLAPSPAALAAAAAPPRPSSNTVIRQAPPEICALLDVPEQRNRMDGLLFNLLWSCGREDELGGSADTDSAVAPGELLDDVQVNESLGEVGPSTTQSETSLTQSLATGTLCSAFNDSSEFYIGGGGITGFSRSVDVAQSWDDRGAVSGISYGDPSLVWRRADGRFYLATLESGGGLAVFVSDDDCLSFQHLATPSANGDDKELLAVDNNPASPRYGNLYLVWTDFGIGGDPIRASRSSDGGVSWSAPVTVSNGGVVQGAWPAVAPNGDVFVAWLRYANWPNGNITVQVSRSTDGGLSYVPVTSPLVNAVSPRDAVASQLCLRPALRGNIRYLASPQIAVDAAGALHIVYSYDPDGFNIGDVVDVFYRRSTDAGASWSPELRLNDVTANDQYFPTIQVGGSTVMATWYDRRMDPLNYLQSYYKRVSTDGGLTWAASQKVSDVPSPIYNDALLAHCYHGDYDQSLLTGTLKQVVQWADDRNLDNGHNDADVWSDAKASSSPVVISSAPAGAAAGLFLEPADTAAGGICRDRPRSRR